MLIRSKFSRWSLAIENRQLEIVNLKFLPAYKAAYPALAAKNDFVFRRLPESLHALGRDPDIYVLIKHFFGHFFVPFVHFVPFRA